MLKTAVVFSCICVFFLLYICACDSDGPVTPSNDKTPPEWNKIVGITGITPGDKTLTITWDTAKDKESEPVVYLLYIDTDNNPWDKTPVEVTSYTPYTFTGLTNYQEYWCGVRCRDSADPPNMDSNTNVLSSTPVVDLWIRTWGGDWDEDSYSIAVDDLNDIYVAGTYSGTTDFDPGPAEELRTSFNRSRDIYLGKFTQYGDFIWVNTWGGVKNEDQPSSVKIDQSGNVYVCGNFQAWVDFDPGPGVDGHEAPLDGSKIYISKFTSDGTLIWVRTWGGEEDGWNFATSMDFDSLGNISIGGIYSGTVDFDPGVGTFPVTFSGTLDVFLSRLTADGDFIDVEVWNGDSFEYMNDIEISTNDSAYAYGSFKNNMDLDPTTGEDLVANRNPDRPDIFLVKIDSNRQYIWGKTWGGTENDYPKDITLDSAGFIYATGGFSATADFDPGPDEYLLVGNADDAPDSFLSKLDPSGNMLWAKSWGGEDWDLGIVVLVDDQFCNVAGRYAEITDFDPGPGIEQRTPGEWDNYVNTFTLDGEFDSVQVCGGPDYNENEYAQTGLAKDNSGYYYLASQFHSFEIPLDLKLGARIEMYSTYAQSSDVFLEKFRIPE